MLDTKGTHEFTLPDLQTAVKECRDIVKSIQGSKQCESGEVLRRCAATLQQRSLELGKQFRSLDVGCQGELPIVTVVCRLSRVCRIHCHQAALLSTMYHMQCGNSWIVSLLPRLLSVPSKKANLFRIDATCDMLHSHIADRIVDLPFLLHSSC